MAFIEYLNNIGFTQVENIEELKISIGKVELAENDNSLGNIKPDLRYYWDGERFGLHISDGNYYIFEDLFINYLEKNNLANCCEIL